WLSSLIRYLVETTPSSSFATLFLGRYEDESGRLLYANCGHNPPLLVRLDGTTEWLSPTAPVVGLFDIDEWSCDVGELAIHPGDTLVLYTDGVTEAQDGDGEFFDEERLVELVQQHRQLPAPALLQTIIDVVTRFSGTVQEDDLTLVIARGLS
ncbi:MAG: PP2C family protein-serine/threonine phosphatase, partial [Gaiellales bacterium]